MKHWLIDAHNYMHTRPELVALYKINRKEALERLILHIESICQHRGRSALIIIDGHATPLQADTEHCSWQFSGDSSADDTIIKKISAKQTSKNWIVISNDRELKRRANNYGVSSGTLGLLNTDQTSGMKSTSRKEAGEEIDPVVTKNELLLMQLSLSQKKKEP